jgi:CRP/FNR family transcriptional regulator
MKRSHIAEYLGLRLETVSRAFSKLSKRGILDLDEGRVLIHDPAGLAHLSEPD